jgi:hypothetical protein
VSARGNGLACRLGQGPRAATPGREHQELLHLLVGLDRTAAHFADRPGRMRARPRTEELAGRHQITAAAGPTGLFGSSGSGL